jgi:hypothetical protein
MSDQEQRGQRNEGRRYLGPSRFGPSTTFKNFDRGSVHDGISFVPVVIFERFFKCGDEQDESKWASIGGGTRRPNFRKRGNNADDEIKKVGKTLELHKRVRSSFSDTCIVVANLLEQIDGQERDEVVARSDNDV